MFSTSKSDGSFSGLAIFSDADKDKLDILKYIKGKSGIYMWTNKINNKSYIGSSVKLNKRLYYYYSLNVNRITYRSLIKNAILKYKLSNFSLDILEYCELDNLIEREQFYIDIIKPEYNIRKAKSPINKGI